MIDVIFKSGLIDEVEKINVGIVGDKEVILPIDDKINILYKNDNLQSYEFLTLQFLKDFCKENEDYNVLYLHTKGVTLESKPINDWRQYMLYFLVEKYEKCFDVLKNNDTCGVDLRKDPANHYSGNFWWAKSNYIKTLIEFNDMIVILSERHKAEFWICSGNGNHYSLWDCGIDVYERHLHEYSKNKYKNDEN